MKKILHTLHVFAKSASEKDGVLGVPHGDKTVDERVEEIHFPARHFCDALTAAQALTPEQAALPDEEAWKAQWHVIMQGCAVDKFLEKSVRTLWAEPNVRRYLGAAFIGYTHIAHAAGRATAAGFTTRSGNENQVSYAQSDRHAQEEIAAAQTTKMLCAALLSHGVAMHHCYDLVSGLAQRGRAAGAFKKLDPQILLMPAIRDMEDASGASEELLKADKMRALLEAIDRQFAE